jgi:hypothetical protein
VEIAAALDITPDSLAGFLLDLHEEKRQELRGGEGGKCG